ncbi:putative nucleoside diphosphate kinase [Glossophaga mutica]
MAITLEGMQCGLVGGVNNISEQKECCLMDVKLLQDSDGHLRQHYIDLKDWPCFLSGEIHELKASCGHVWEVLNVVKAGPAMPGETNLVESKPGTIQGAVAIRCSGTSFMAVIQ